MAWLRILLIIGSEIILPYWLIAQKQANNWMFGDKVGMTFKNNRPEPIFSNIQTVSGCASISSPRTGELLFYTNGMSVWNRRHEIMQNGQGLKGDSLASQSAFIAPFYADTNKYYLFTLSITDPEITTSAELHYSEIDMTLDQGFGAVVESRKNVFLTDHLTEKMTIIRHFNKKDLWLILHEVNSNAFLIYLVSEKGISFHNRISIGAVHPTASFDINSGAGQLKASPNGERLAITQFSDRSEVPFEMFQFDKVSGLIYAPLSLGNFISQYGVSFSPDNTKLYLDGICLSCPEPVDFLYQFDLEAMNVVGSRVGLLNNNPNFDLANFTDSFASIALQNAPDGRIYSAGSGQVGTGSASTNLLIINNPNAKGLASDVKLQAINFEEGTVRNGLPCFIEEVFDDLTPTDNPNAPCQSELALKVYPNPTRATLTIEVTEHCFSPYRLSIFNTLGQEVGAYVVSDPVSEPINVSYLATGIYIIVIEGHNLRLIQQFVKN